MSKKFIITVEGNDLQSRLDTAQTQARDASRHRYWAAYKFPVRPNVSVDAGSMSPMGIEMQVGVVTTGNVGEDETRSLGVFLLYGERELLRVEIYNLERQRDYDGWPIYWLGEVEAPESLALLSSLVRRTKNETIGAKLVEAITVHDSPQVEELLTDLTRSSPLVAVRAGAVFTLGRFGQNLALVEAVAGDGREHTQVRQQAIMALGKCRTPGAFDALRRLAGVIREHSLREAIVNAVGRSQQPGAAELLKTFAERTDDPALSRRAQQLLDKASGAKRRIKDAKRRAYAHKYCR
jgi:hypothetical protein